MDRIRGLRERPAWYLELPLLIGGYLLFGVARAGLDRGDPTATRDAVLVHSVEQMLHIAVESSLNTGSLEYPLVIYSTGYFYRLCLIAVPAVLIWLYLRWPARYRCLRTVLVVTTLLDLPLVWLFPESPPRFSLDGIVDYVATYDIVGGAGLREARSGVNLLAAMPSMHVAWTTWCAYAVWSVLRRRRPTTAWLAWLYPVLTSLVVLATGHHYVLDIAAGIALVAVAVVVTRWLVSRAVFPGFTGASTRGWLRVEQDLGQATRPMLRASEASLPAQDDPTAIGQLAFTCAHCGQAIASNTCRSLAPLAGFRAVTHEIRPSR